uniref:Uncharacterized protein n=1 Tax=Arundo donax TaxID=35708 RepID=A0A0A8ZP99_ARUDO
MSCNQSVVFPQTLEEDFHISYSAVTSQIFHTLESLVANALFLIRRLKVPSLHLK